MGSDPQRAGARLTRPEGRTAGRLYALPATRIDRRRARRVWRRLALFAVALLAGYQLALLVGLWRQGTLDERRPVDAILVLGAAQWNGAPSPVLRARLDHAVELYRDGYAPRVTVTGGVGNGDRYSEAGVAADYLRDHGIPPDAILGEDRGRSSLESIRGAASVLAARGVSRVLLVSDPPHMLRILRMAQAAGLEAYGSPATASPAVGSLPAQARFLLRELVLYDGYVWFGLVPTLGGHPLSLAHPRAG
jgi:uncharacterized SAM-binding protein YcdF (DUF218 family)